MSAAHALLLVVDDTVANRYVKVRILKGVGFDVIEAGTGAEALRLLGEHKPDLVLLDVRLPDTSGRVLAATIKSDPNSAHVVVLQTSASHVDTAHRVASLEAGADGYLVEPIEPEELVAHVRALLRMRRAELERQKALEDLREADRRKDEFLAMLAHELRNPLAPIRNAVEIMRLAPDSATQARARELIARQTAHLARLVDDLLEMSRITQRKLVLQPREVSLASLLDAALEVARAYVEKNGQDLSVSAPAEDVWLQVDPVRISQVIGNLLHNASKFTPRGGSVSLVARRVPDGVELEVSDTGIGIAPELLKKVFDLFSQADRSLDRAQGGLGIGLSLVRGLVEMHGGSVAASSEGEGKGSVFHVRLPNSRIVEAPFQRSSPSPVPAPTHGRRRILVVEDNPDSAEAMAMLLRELGHEVALVGDGNVAVGVARQFEPDVILLDIGLPGIDGYELARRLRLQEETRGARMIAITGYGQPSDRERSVAAGFDQHLVKPVDPSRLAAAVNAPLRG